MSVTSPVRLRRKDSLPPCGGGLGWGGARTDATASSSEVTSHPNPPPQGGRENNSPTLTLPHKGGGNRTLSAVCLSGPGFAALLFCLIVPAFTPATELQQRRGSGTLTLTADIIEKKIVQLPLSGAFTITLTLEGKTPLEIEDESRCDAKLVWQVRSDKPELTDLPNGRQRWRQRLHIEPLKVGEQLFQLTPLQYREADGDSQTISWDAIETKVTTSVLRPALSEIRDIPTIEPPPPAPEPTPWLWWLAGGVSGLSLGLVAGWLLWRRRRPPPEPPARVIALRELAALTENDPTRLNLILREYVERRFNIPATRQTTGEVVVALRQVEGVNAEQVERLESILQRCDAVRFAPTGMLEAGAIAEARAWVEGTIPAERVSAG